MKAKNTEQKILEAAEAVFLEKGFSATKTTEIAQRASVNHALIHYYFRTKENLFETIFVARLKSILESFEGILSLEISFSERIEKIINAYFDLFLDNPQMPIFMLNEFFINKERLEFFKHKIVSLTSHLQDHFEHATQKAVEAREIRLVNARDLLINIFSLNSSVFVSKTLNQSLFDWNNEEYVNYIGQRKDAIVDFVLHSIQVVK